MVTPVSCPFGWLFPLSKHLPYRGRPEGLSFYYSLVYLSTKALNSVEAFDYALCDGELVRLGGRRPSFTDLKKARRIFILSPCPWKRAWPLSVPPPGKKRRPDLLYRQKPERAGSDLFHLPALGGADGAYKRAGHGPG